MAGFGFGQLTRGTPEFFSAALRGKVPGVRRVVFSGYNSDIDVATVPEDIFPALTTTLIPAPSSAESWEIVSDNVNDTSAGTGARTVSITTLDGAYAEVTQTVTLNGTTAVALTGTHIRINAAAVVTAGSSGNNSGLLTIRVAGAGAARGYLSAGDGILNQCKYTVPASHSLELYAALLGLTTNISSEAARITFVSTNSSGRQANVVRIPLFAGGTNLYRHEIGDGLIPFNTLPEKNEFTVRVLSVTQNNTQIDASVLGLLYDTALWP